MTSTLVVTQAAVRVDGRRVARLLWSGRCVKVEGLGAKGLGRLLPAGCLEGRPDDGRGLYDVYTAKHPLVHTPSDEPLGRDLTLSEGIALIIGGAQ